MDVSELSGPEELLRRGLTRPEAEGLLDRLAAIPPVSDARDRWAHVSRTCLSPSHPLAVHELLFARVYGDWGAQKGPPPAWIPPKNSRRRTNLGRFLDETGFGAEGDLRAWALADRAGFWAALVKVSGIRFARPPAAVLDPGSGPGQERWFPGARLNVAESRLQAPPGASAIRQFSEAGSVRDVTYGELERLSGRVALGLRVAGLVEGDPVGVLMPMTIEAVAVLLGIFRAGGVAVLVAESFAPPEIEQRLRLGKARLVITQEAVLRRGVRLELSAKLADCPLRAVVIPASDATPTLRPGDLTWDEFMPESVDFENADLDPSSHAMILFSSGTTGEPKAIPWSQATPIKAAADGFLYQDIGPGDVVAWPTSPGWMMGPWLIFATLVNGATLALYEGHPGSEGFCGFVQEAGVTVLGVVPSLVAAWKESDWPSRFNWGRIKLFSSTGECSRPGDMFYLMSRAGYRPVIEYCGGTEVGGGYLTSTPLLPNAPGCFNTIAYGIGISLRDEEGRLADPGEAFLIGPSVGLSTELLHRDHHEVYSAGTPRDESGSPLRRHGDRVEALPGGFFRVLGRADDAMNLGGIKVAAVEIERVLDRHPLVRESAAVAVSDPGGGPERLVAYLVLSGTSPDLPAFRAELQTLLRERLNPLFRISDVFPVASLPRTASNKVLRRELREEARRAGNPPAPRPG